MQIGLCVLFILWYWHSYSGVSASALRAPPPSATITPSPTIAKREPVWRAGTSYSEPVSVCKPMTLTEGTIVHGSTTIYLDRFPAVFTPECKNGHPVTNVVRVGNATILTTLSQSWKDWIQSDNGNFQSSLYPYMYSLSCSMVICMLLNVVIFDGGSCRPLLQRVSITLSSAYLLVIYIQTTIDCRSQYFRGYFDSDSLRNSLKNSTKINILNLIFTTFLLMAQVQTLMSLFPRQKEKRLIFWIGAILIVVCQTLWGISVFHIADNDSALPAFVYLFQLSISIMYVGLVVYYIVTKNKAIKHANLIIYTTITLLATLAPIALFIVDLGGWWEVEWTDSVSWLCKVLSIVIVWEWAERVEKQERHDEHNRVLGRQVFEDDMHYPDSSKQDGASTTIELDEFSAGNNSNSNNNNSNNGDNGGATGATGATVMQERQLYLSTPLSTSSPPSENAFLRTIQRAISPIVWLSDQLVELGYHGFSIRSGSTSNNSAAAHSPENPPTPQPPSEYLERYVHPMPHHRRSVQDDQRTQTPSGSASPAP